MPLSLARVSPFADPQARSSGASLSTADGRSLALVGVRLRGDARGGIARLVLEQRFVNPFEETLDVTYRMPLPADGAVSAYAFEIAGRVILGRVDKKAAARETYERALVEGRTAALLEQNTNDVFTQQIGNLPPKEELVARITIDQRLAWLPEGEWELRFPTVIGPRYIGASDSEATARETHVSVEPAGIAAGIQIAITIGDSITSGRTAASPTHTLLHRADGSIELKDEAALDRDIVVRWPVASAKPGVSIEVARRASGDAYALLTIVPPARATKPQAVARDLIVLLDTSGSMGGMPLDAAKVCVAMLVETLGEQDRLELIEFSNSPRRYKPQPVAATEREKTDAIKWVKSRRADGGTEMGAAVYEALHAIRPNAQRQVVLVTDGYIGGEAQIVKLLHENLPKSCRMHVLGVGSSVNRSLATALARAGRGAEVLVGPDEDPERAIKRMIDRTASPMLTNVSILGSGLVRHAPEHLPDVYEGSPIVAALQVEPEGGEIVVRGELAREPWEQRIRVPAKQVGEGNGAIACLYAREHVADLETRWTLGDTNRIDREIETTGVEFQIATRLTSWIAVDMIRKTDKQGPSRHQTVPQNLPYGTSAESFGLRGSTPLALGGMAMMNAMSPLAIEEEYDAPMAGAPAAFEKEEATGRMFAQKTPAQPQPMSSVPPLSPRPSMQTKSGIVKEYAPGAGGFAQPLETAKAEPVAQAAALAKSRRSLWLAIMVLMIVVALLLWWLVL
jgi:Ca-activated chloride channel family protein